MINAPKLLKTNQTNAGFSLSSSLLNIDLPKSISDKRANFFQLAPAGVRKSNVMYDDTPPDMLFRDKYVSLVMALLIKLNFSQCDCLPNPTEWSFL